MISLGKNLTDKQLKEAIVLRFGKQDRVVYSSKMSDCRIVNAEFCYTVKVTRSVVKFPLGEGAIPYAARLDGHALR